MYILKTLVILMTLTLTLIPWSEGRGYLIDPPGRASMWRYGFGTPRNYNDNGLNCGGYAVQWGNNGGRCGVCGDSYSGVRDNEAGGKYATGTIGRHYIEGQVVRTKIIISSAEYGWFEFHLCAHNNASVPVSEACLNHTLLQLVQGGTRYQLNSQGAIHIDVILPMGITCSQCVFRWKWNAGNMWGWSESGQPCVGCGQQEQFYNCADISVGPYISPGHVGLSTAGPTAPTSAAPTTTSLTTTSTSTTPALTPEKTTTTLPYPSPSESHSNRCYGIHLWSGDLSLDAWCQLNCLTFQYCPQVYCGCDPPILHMD